MSDFDKEAEREKLREKYGQEEEKRQATEQMSELLLKGATMTNAHCTDCGDPIFRYDGQEFCPTCQKPVARDQSGADADGDQDGHIEVADPSDDATVQFGDGQDGVDAGETEQDASAAAEQARANDAADASADASAAGSDAARQQPAPDQPADAAGHPSPADATQGVPSADPGRTPAAGDARERGADTQSADPPADAVATGSDASASTPDRSPASSRRSGGDESVTTELSAAESLLAETVHRFAQRAAETDDPRTAREHLGAAREAAEALDAVRF
ncbi:Sjogren's syndrome/scleroderma autoantigen 1 family protein [Haloarcula sediminis]|uniref:Sjogren's syndrome/scleroderma autoantigen 1 family protein n=1 Tax=Haloarcula sediminis TaxID=3111777 RepID=UPI002D77E8CB|nr:Sjogren's syndrome/scleroderma autoantigen 1 family protein [Haloarcula sp. CK38]